MKIMLTTIQLKMMTMPSKNSAFLEFSDFLAITQNSLKNYDNSWVMKEYEYDQLLKDFNSIQNYQLQY